MEETEKRENEGKKNIRREKGMEAEPSAVTKQAAGVWLDSFLLFSCTVILLSVLCSNLYLETLQSYYTRAHPKNPILA